MILLEKIKNLQKSEVKEEVEKRLKEFSAFKNKGEKEWFSELCFCILTANSKAETAIKIQLQLKPEGFWNASEEEVKRAIIHNKHRFHNNKSKFIVNAREFKEIKKLIQKLIPENEQKEAREWIVQNIKGLGYKEASHFLRNVGYFDLAILDRHILNLMVENKYIEEKPISLNKKKYLEIEAKFEKIAKKMKMSCAELDLYMWFLKTGKVLK